MFTITKGIDNDYVFTIKQDGSTEVLPINSDYTFKFSLKELSDNIDAALIPIGDPSTVTGITNITGKVNLHIPASQTTNLISKVGPSEDRFYRRPTYALIVECDTKTSVNGKFTARIDEVYVK